MKKIFLTIITFCILQSYSQVGIGTTNPHPSSILDINSATQGLLVPRLTTIERNAISAPANGLMIYNTTISCFEFYNGITWQSLCNTSLEPTISSIPCNAPFTVTPSGNGVAGLPYNKTVSIPYLGGNGGAYPSGTSIASTGVTGLTATLNAGTLANGAGNFTFTITGTPDPFVSVSNTATATFPFTFDGKNCSFTVTIDKARIGSTISCTTAVVENPATGINGSPYNGTITITYSNSILTNGGAYAAQSITSTGVTGLTATISSGFVNPAGGTLVFNVTGTPNSTGNAQFNLSNFINGLTCSGSNVQIVISGTPLVSSLNCSAASHSPATATQLSAYSGITTLPYTGGNGLAYSSQSITSTGVLGLTATLTPGTLALGNGNLNFNVTGTPTSSGFASFSVTFGGQTCVFSIRVNGRVISIAYIDGSSYYATSEFGQQTVPQNYGPTGIFNTIGGILHDDYTSTFNSSISPLTMKNTREIIACGPNKSGGARSVTDCQRIRDYVALGGIAIITLDANDANAITTSTNYHTTFGGTGTFIAGANPTTVNSTIALSSSYWGTANPGISIEGVGVSAEFSGTSYTLPIGAQVLARFTNGKPAIWTCGEGNRAIFICDNGFLRNSTYFTTITVNTDQERFFHNLLKNYVLVHLGF
ncbi:MULTISPECIES: hypothetical protein [unclassified Flavobacterium]|uniref:hypothetical protein n=1 Tax=unclassified Flavobacterium TaxID=196869 RepID=UPI0012909D39|nr:MULTISPECIES: hypothetical protein [unclassified Flavobacterium]MQP51506.1 hypothetical protein [Flavobacterium sp. LMO9]MQP61266.1 hypothetical protein [Flavobacterium sp. LMO6]